MPSSRASRTAGRRTLKAARARTEGECALPDSALAAALQAVALELRRSMQELGATGARRIGAADIANATDELDAIVSTTASATGAILDACEIVEATAARLGESAEADALRAAASDIYQACGFQDLTGQRVANIVAALRRIDRRVTAACAVVGLEPDVGFAAAARTTDGADSLTNGPALPDEAMTQREIDRILAKRD